MADDLIADRPSRDGRSALLYDDLVSRQLDSVHSTASTLLGHQVFAGNQPDDFAIAGLTASAPRVLMLGLGLGGSLRSILAANPRTHVTALDLSERSLRMSRALHDLYFPEVHYDEIVGDAQYVSDLVEGSFDAICIDIYSDEGYPSFVSRSRFWDAVKAMRRDNSSPVMFNSWGLPTHLGWSECSSDQTTVASAMQDALGPLSALPHRRNVTLSTPLLRRGDIESVKPGTAGPRPRIDAIQLRLLRLRARCSASVRFEGGTEADGSWDGTKASLNSLMQIMWPSAVERLSRLADKPGRAYATLGEIIGDDAALDAIASSATQELHYFLPNVASNWIHQHGVMPEWYRRATMRNFLTMIEADRAQFILGWFTQYVAILLKCPSGLESSVNLLEWVSSAEDVLVALEMKE